MNILVYLENGIEMLETEERHRIETIKQSERQRATEDLEQWKQQQIQIAQQEKERLLKEKLQREKQRQIEEQRHIFDTESTQKSGKKSKKNMFAEAAGDAPTRAHGTIEVAHTPRVFPTPMRESQSCQEEEWLKKQANARKTVEIEDEDLTEEERNPLWMRDKGNKFFQAGNYLAAINAFSHAIRLDSKMPSLYSNRAACHLKQGNCMKCIEDCSKALELLTPPVPQNLSSRCKAHVRRGTAFCNLELYVEGLMDYEAALKLDNTNEQLQADADRIRTVIQGSTQNG